MTNSGGILSTWLFPAEEAPAYRRGTIINMSFSIVVGIASGLNILYLWHANKQKAKREAEATPATWHIEGDRHPSYK